jgi:hypothetical protein
VSPRLSASTARKGKGCTGVLITPAGLCRAGQARR